MLALEEPRRNTYCRVPAGRLNTRMSVPCTHAWKGVRATTQSEMMPAAGDAYRFGGCGQEAAVGADGHGGNG